MPFAFTFNDIPLTANIVIFSIAALVIGVAGWRLAGSADVLADRTGMGEAIAGALFLGAATSLPGIVTSVTTAIGGYSSLAISNAIGGIAIQTVFLAVADLTYRRANLEHAAASVPSIMQGALLIIILTVPLLAVTTPVITFWSIHPATIIMFAIYIYGMRIVSKAQEWPMWKARQTSETREDVPDEAGQRANLVSVWVRFGVLAAIVGVAGWVVARTGVAISEQSGLSETAVGALLTAVVTSLPELVTSVAAVRQGAHTLAVSGIIGGNAFDTLFAAVADIAYREGSLYHTMTTQHIFLIVLTMLMTGVLLLGLLRREEKGLANIGFESVSILILYVGGALFLLFGSGTAL
jgi:cation:H+ antiporter